MSENPVDIYIKVVRDAAIGWIGSADTKATALLAIQGVLLGLIGAKLDSIERVMWYYFLIGFFVASGLSCMASICVLWPRTNRKCLDVRSTDDSVTFFGDVAKKKDSDALIESLRTLDDAKWRSDAVRQAYIVNKVAAKKMWWLRIAVVLVLVGFGCLIVSTGLHVMDQWSSAKK